MRRKFAVVSLTAGAMLLCAAAWAQDEPPDTPPPPETEVEKMSADTDPTKPVALSLRNEFFDVRGPSWINYSLLRVDRLVLEEKSFPLGTKGVILRGDLPIVTVDDGLETQTGLGDIYGQALFIARPKKTFFLAIGSGLLLPTATDDSLGRGKWILAPAIAPVWFFPKKGFFFLKFQDYVSFAGESDRPDVHYLLVTPTFLWRLSGRWWMVLDGESTTDWERDEATWYKAGALIGRMLSSRSGVSLKVEVPFGDDRPFDIIARAVFFRTRF